MKSLCLLLGRLKQYCVKNKLIFTLFLIGGMLNAVSLTYCYGNLLPSVANKNSEASHYRNYSVSFKNQLPQVEDIERFLADPLVESYALTAGNNVYACGGNYPMIRISGSLAFTQPYQVIAPMMTDCALGEHIILYDHSFEVIGISSDSERYFIPYETYISLGLMPKTTRINAYATYRQDPLADQMYRLIQTRFPYSTEGGMRYEATMADAYASEIFFRRILINTFLAVLAYSFLLNYIMDALTNENIISVILGAGKSRMAVQIFWEALILSMAVNGLGFAVHALLYRAVFVKLNIYEHIRYSPGDYCLLGAVMLVLSVIAILPVVIRSVHSTPAAARRRSL